MKLLTTTIALALTLSSLAAEQESYVARLSAKDHFNSSGERLDSAAAIIRQDRANFHKFNARDGEDETDTFFANARNRELLEKYLESGSADKAALRSIVNGTPLIRVSIFTNQKNAGTFIRVKILSED